MASACFSGGDRFRFDDRERASGCGASSCLHRDNPKARCEEGDCASGGVGHEADGMQGGL